jgi:hypothetical protein
MKQTAVEWLVDILELSNPSKQYQAEIQQAKEMEKGQIMKTWYDCKLSIIERNPTDAEQYYNETFKSE